jgi:hypothetical protein
MTTEQHAWATSPGTQGSSGPSGPPVCACGQDLDVSHGTNCPRCGTSLLAHAA